jgi:hypothetical protein
VQWRDDQETLLSLAQIISVERVNRIECYKVQLRMLIKVKDLPKGIPVPKIQPPHYHPNIKYPMNVAYTDYITTVDCHDIKGIIFVFTPNNIECSPAANCCGMDHAFMLQYGVLFGKSDRVVVSELLMCFHPTSCYSNRMLSTLLNVINGIEKAMSKKTFSDANMNYQCMYISDEFWSFFCKLLQHCVDVSFERKTTGSFLVKHPGGYLENICHGTSTKILRVDLSASLKRVKHALGKYINFMFALKPKKMITSFTKTIVSNVIPNWVWGSTVLICTSPMRMTT